MNWDAVNREMVDQTIQKFIQENGDAEEVINKLFAHANNSNFDDVFVRVACIDLIYSTQIQKFNKGGIVVVAKHIQSISTDIDAAIKKHTIEFGIYDELVKVDYCEIKSDKGKEARLYSFASKFLSFSKPDVYPIMDSRVKKALGVSCEMKYRQFCDEIEKAKKILEEKGIRLTLKELDMFLWQWEKDHEESRQ